MAINLPRITQKIFAENAAANDMLQFGSVLAGSAAPANDIEQIQTDAYQTGWRGAVISNRNYPTLGEMNAVQKVPTQQLAYILQKGIPEWDVGTTYFANICFCQVNGIPYQSLTNDNIGNNPATDDGTHWQKLNFNGANLDLSNITTSAKEMLISLPFIAGSSTDITLGASNTDYLARETGWVVSRGLGRSMSLFNSTSAIGFEMQPVNASSYITLTIKVVKGDIYNYAYSNGSQVYFKFIKAKGELT